MGPDRGNRRGHAPPDVLQLVAHPLRWRLLEELGRTDRRVSELTDRLGAPQSLVSYHLGRLRRLGLVTARRSSKDARDVYYGVELTRCGDLLSAAGAALHPGLRLMVSTAAPSVAGRGGVSAIRVLFVCTGNSGRSPMAEALTTHVSGGAITTASAGSHPKTLHPNAVRVMAERGIDIAGRRSKHLDAFAGQHFDYVVTLCDRVREICPTFAGQHEPIHWSIADPAREGDSDEATYPAFQRVASELTTRIGFLLHRVSALNNQPKEGKCLTK
jgi:protein-tyrosine-phosphatase/DNA-binding transcriptional ArsR family regulator